MHVFTAQLQKYRAVLQETTLIWILLGCCLGAVPYLVYSALVFHIGVVPAEFYSSKKRVDYKLYQQTTNMFFPGPPICTFAAQMRINNSVTTTMDDISIKPGRVPRNFTATF
eukprot:m.200427 g.200427  ORF g.200427 m.200427 type:complete len:112 (+) comp18793_c0_seq1:325-660(+)